MKKGILISVIVVLIGAIVFTIGMYSIKKISASKNQFDRGMLLKTYRKEDNNEADENIKTIAILGVDNKSNTEDSNTSDAIVIAKINTKTKNIELTSINKDIYTHIDGYGNKKITQACKLGGAELALKTINKYLHLNITEYIVVNNEALANIIDALEGIEIDIQEQEIEEFNNLLKEEKINNTIKEAGTYTLSGNEALAYSKIIYKANENKEKPDQTEEILIAGFYKAQNSNITQLAKLVRVLFPQVKTNISIIEMLKYVPYAKTYKINKSIVYTDNN